MYGVQKHPTWQSHLKKLTNSMPAVTAIPIKVYSSSAYRDNIYKSNIAHEPFGTLFVQLTKWS